MHLPNIHIKIIPHDEQRYDTCGDYYEEGDTVQFRISQLTPDEEFLVLMHELGEWYLTQKKGVTIDEIDAFDKEFEKNRVEGNTDEPGDDINAPYREEHFFMTSIERLLAQKLGVDWKEYEEHINNL